MAIEGNPEDDIKELSHKTKNKGMQSKFKKGSSKHKRKAAIALFDKDHESKKSLKRNGKLKSSRKFGPKGYGRKG